MELIQVNIITHSDRNRYSECGYNHNGEFVPNGYGKKFFREYNVYGNFKHGIIDEPAIESHDINMETTQFKNNHGNGWGLCMNRGQLSGFCYYENSTLKIVLSDFVLWYFTKMQKTGCKANMLTAYTYNDTFIKDESIEGLEFSAQCPFQQKFQRK